MENKRGRIRHAKILEAAVAILGSTCDNLALADNFKAAIGEEYKNTTVTRVEVDRILVKFSGGIVKIPFTGNERCG